MSRDTLPGILDAEHCNAPLGMQRNIPRSAPQNWRFWLHTPLYLPQFLTTILSTGNNTSYSYGNVIPFNRQKCFKLLYSTLLGKKCMKFLVRNVSISECSL